jgi:hypothetical protein
MGLLMRSMFVSPVLALAVPLVACVDPQQDYNDYSSRTGDAHAPPASTFDAGGETGPLYAPDAGFMSNDYFLSCLTTAAEGDVTKASQSVAHITYVPDASGGGGTLTYGDSALKVNPTSLSDTTGMFYTSGPTTSGPGPIKVNPDGTAAALLGPSTIPADGNAVTGMDLTFTSSTVNFHIESMTQICGNFVGNLVMPTVTVVTGPCVLRLLPSATSPLPPLQLSDFHCP